jgi:acylphosphatase
MERIEILVSGKVQGVFFRAFITKKARELGLCGFVSNLSDGKVKIIAQGKRENLEKLLDYAKIGPPLAKVLKVDFKWSRSLEPFDDFVIRHNL